MGYSDRRAKNDHLGAVCRSLRPSPGKAYSYYAPKNRYALLFLFGSGGISLLRSTPYYAKKIVSLSRKAQITSEHGTTYHLTAINEQSHSRSCAYGRKTPPCLAPRCRRLGRHFVRRRETRTWQP